MAAIRYRLALLLVLLWQWAAAPCPPVHRPAPAKRPRVTRLVLPLAVRYRQDLRSRMALASLSPAARGTTPSSWSSLQARQLPEGPARPNLLYLLMSLRW